MKLNKIRDEQNISKKLKTKNASNINTNTKYFEFYNF